MKVPSSLFPVSIVLCSTLVLGSPCFGDDQEEIHRDQGQLLIRAVYVDRDANTLRILGENLGEGQSADVRMGAYPFPLSIVSHTPRSIEVELPAGIADGDYLLTVSTGMGIRRNDAYDLTIGAAGPEGPRGLQGEQGDEGEKGDRGDTGDDGSPGVTGPPGAKGVKGDIGPPGPAGPPGGGGPFTVRQVVYSNDNSCFICVFEACSDQSLLFSNAELSADKSVELSWEAPDGHAWIKGLSHSFVPSTSPGLPPTLQVNYQICTRAFRHSRPIDIYIIVGQ